MSITLSTYNNGDTNYVAKLNQDNSTLQIAINALQSAVGGTAGAQSNSTLNSLLGPSAAFVGSNSFNESSSGTVLTLTGGYAWRPDLGKVGFAAASATLDFTGNAAGTYYIVVDGTGTATISAAVAAGSLYSVVWTGTAFGAIAAVAPIVWNFFDWTLAQTSTALSLYFSSLSARFEHDEGLILALTTTVGGLSGGLTYKGTWNASTNTPTLASGTGTNGWLYKVSTAGTTTLDGVSSWSVGDILVFDGTHWEKFDGNPSEVLSVAGRTGAVTLTDADITYGTEAANKVFAGPVSGSAAAPTYRSLVAADIPPIRYHTKMFLAGTQTAANQLMLRDHTVIADTIPTTGNRASAGTGATASTVLTIQKNGSSVGTITFAASGGANALGTFSISSAISLAVDDILTIVGPATADATLADISVSLAGVA